jgi:hypothetical protein
MLSPSHAAHETIVALLRQLQAVREFSEKPIADALLPLQPANFHLQVPPQPFDYISLYLPFRRPMKGREPNQPRGPTTTNGTPCRRASY